MRATMQESSSTSTASPSTRKEISSSVKSTTDSVTTNTRSKAWDRNACPPIQPSSHLPLGDANKRARRAEALPGGTARITPNFLLVTITLRRETDPTEIDLEGTC